MSEYRRRDWRYDRDFHDLDDEEPEMVVRPLVFVEDELPPVASAAEPQERQW